MSPRGKIQQPAALRQAFADFFTAKGHAQEESAPLLAAGDESLLFVNSGMVPFKDVFAGKEKRPYRRAVTCQKCLRVSGKHNDFEQIGKTARHHTFFEMLGNFSFGDYFKQDAILYAWEFLTEVVGLPKSLLWVTVHHQDEEARALWSKHTDVDSDRIVGLGDDSNLWAMGDTGPWGYCSEIFCYIGSSPESQSREEFLLDDGTYLEIWNLVFMEFFRDGNGQVSKLPLQCIDTGMGLERLASVTQGVTSNYDTADLRRVIAAIEEEAGASYDGRSFHPADFEERARYDQDVAMRVIADHARATAFLIADGVVPGNEGESYVLRRLIRRALRFGVELGLDEPFLGKVVSVVAQQMGGAYGELRERHKMIVALTHKEEVRFRSTLSHGVALLNTELEGKKTGFTLPGELAFKLYDTFGFPVDLARDVLQARGMTLDEEGFSRELEAQRNRSRGAASKVVASLGNASSDEAEPTLFTGYNDLSCRATVGEVLTLDDGTPVVILDKTPFYAEMGGQVGDAGVFCLKDGKSVHVTNTVKLPDGRFGHLLSVSDAHGCHPALAAGVELEASVDEARRREIAAHHSATHLLNAALRQILGSHVVQRGSLVTDEKLRFDFSHSSAVTAEELDQILVFVNQEIRLDTQVITEELSLETAKEKGAVAAFGEKYGDEVRVVTIGDSSKELCGGTHVGRSGEIGCFLLASEGSVASGVRRIEAFAGNAAIAQLKRREEMLRGISSLVKGKGDDLIDRVQALVHDQRSLQKDIKARDREIAKLLSRLVVSQVSQTTEGLRYVADLVDTSSRDVLLDVAADSVRTMRGGVAIIGSRQLGAIALKVSKDLVGKVDAGRIAKKLCEVSGGRGGGRPDSAFVGGVSPENISSTLQAVSTLLQGDQ